MAFSQAIDWAARVGLAVRGGGNVDNPEIDAQPVVRLKRRWLGDLDHDRQVESTLTVNQIRLPTKRKIYYELRPTNGVRGRPGFLVINLERGESNN